MPIPLAAARKASSLRRCGSRHLLINTLTAAVLLLLTFSFSSPALALQAQLKASVSQPPVLNQNTDIKVSVISPDNVADGVVDVEIFDSAGQRVLQKFFEHQNLAAAQNYDYSVTWQPQRQDNYRLKVGIFDSNWSRLLYWNDQALDLMVGQTPAQTAAPMTTVTAPAAVAGRSLPLTLTVKPDFNLSGGIIDLEIYSSDGKRIFQKFQTGFDLKSGSTHSVTFTWTPQNPGSYQVKSGIFDNNWAALRSWNDKALTLDVAPSSSAVPAAATTPTPAVLPSQPPAGPSLNTGYKVGADGRIYDPSGKQINLNGVSWFGFENGTMVLHGLWERNWQDMIKQISDSGFNALRVPYCPNTLRNSEVSSVDYYKNEDLKGLKSLDIMDKFLAELNARGLYFMLDLHTSDCKTITDLWTTDGYSEQQWVDDLVFLAKRYQSLSHFVGIDIKNEPKGIATWGTGDVKTDWKMAAEKAGRAILAANPGLLIFVQGVQDNPVCSDNSNGHWWGGNLQPESCHPISLPKDKVVFTPHVYGPDVHPQGYFNDPAFPANLTGIWNTHFGFLRDQNKAVAIGEWGGKFGSGDPKDVIWQNSFVDYLVNKGICNSFYWSWNPNSTDTGGILNDDWKTVRTDKLNLINRYVSQCR